MSIADDIAALETKIAAVSANNNGNYQVGDTSVDAGDFLKTLWDIKFKLLELQSRVPVESWDTFDTYTDPLGLDLAEYLTAEPG